MATTLAIEVGWATWLLWHITHCSMSHCHSVVADLPFSDNVVIVAYHDCNILVLQHISHCGRSFIVTYESLAMSSELDAPYGHHNVLVNVLYQLW